MAGIAGKAEIVADGIRFIVADSLNVQPSTTKREKVAGLGGIAGYKEETVPAVIEGTAFLTPGLDVSALAAIVDGNITASIGDRSFAAAGATWCEPAVHSASEGTFPFRFECSSGDYV